MVAIYIIVAVLILLNILVVIEFAKRSKEHNYYMNLNANMYDDDGNHIYYDRKYIKHLKEKKEKTQTSH